MFSSIRTSFRPINRFSIPFALVTMLGLAASLTATTASADTSRFHGTICNAYYGSQEDDLRRYNNGLRNNTGSSRWVSCAMDQDVVWYSGSGDAVIWAYVNNASATQNLYCEAYSVDPLSGGTEDSYSTSVSSGNRSMTLYVRQLGSNAIHVRCLLPAYSYVRSFYFFEQG